MIRALALGLALTFATGVVLPAAVSAQAKSEKSDAKPAKAEAKGAAQKKHALIDINTAACWQ